jgi:anti-sigma factor RsiW
MLADEDDELGALIRREAVRHAPPPGLLERIRTDLEATQAPAAPKRPAVRPRAARWGWLQAVSLFGAGAATAWGLALALLVTPLQEATIDAVTDSHVRSLMGAHLNDVISTDQHTVKPWFTGKLDFSPPVVDLAADGMPLTGGRLDYLDGRPVAALVYRAGPHTVNLFIWPAASGASDSAPQLLNRRGFNLVHWDQDGMQAWAVSDLNAAELQAFAALARERIAAAEGPARR